LGCVRTDAPRPCGRVFASARMQLFARTRPDRADASVLPPCNFITEATVRPNHRRPSGHRPIVRPPVHYHPRDNPGVDSVSNYFSTSEIGSKCWTSVFAMGFVRVLFLVSECLPKQVRVVPSINTPIRVNPSLFCSEKKEPWALPTSC
jgi:hypothetical protein